MASPYYVATTGDDTTGDGSSGSPWATPGYALGQAVAGTSGWIIWVKAGTYDVSSTSSNVADGVLNYNQSATGAAGNKMEGYTTTIGDGGKFTLNVTHGGTATIVTMTNDDRYNRMINFIITGEATSGLKAMSITGRANQCDNFEISGFTGGGTNVVYVGAYAKLRRFKITGGNTGSFAALGVGSGASATQGEVSGNAGRGLYIDGAGNAVIGVISHSHTGVAGYGFYVGGGGDPSLENCIAHSNSKDGFFTSTNILRAHGCIAAENAESGWDVPATGADLVACAGFDNTSGDFSTTPTVNVNFSALTADPFTDAAGGDFSLNNVAGGGAVLRAVTQTVGSTTTYPFNWLAAPAAGGGGGSFSGITPGGNRRIGL